MTTFVLGMITMWIICGLIAMLAEYFNASRYVTIFAVGGFFWFPLMCLLVWLDNVKFKREMKKKLDKQNQK